MTYTISNTLKRLFVVLTLIFATAACDGPVGPQGERGPQGPEGPQGPTGQDGQDGADGQDGQQGPQGPAGEDGEDGNANVFYSPWYDLNLTGTGDETRSMTKIIPQITQDIVDSGLVLVYVRGTFNSAPNQLPYTSFTTLFPPRPHSLLRHFFYIVENSSPTGRLRFVATRIQTNWPVSDFSGWEYRFIIVPGGVPIGNLQAGLHAESALNDYDAIKAHFGIPEEGSGFVPIGARQ